MCWQKNDSTCPTASKRAGRLCQPGHQLRACADRIVLESLRGESSIAELCRKEGINQNLYYRWSKEFLEAGKKRLAGDTAREANSDEVKELRSEAAQLKQASAERCSRIAC
jgi:transposase-like protein